MPVQPPHVDPNMNQTEKIKSISDCLEQGRNADVCCRAEMLRQVVKGDTRSLEQKMKFLTDNNFLKSDA